jgi:hypothetical protein
MTVPNQIDPYGRAHLHPGRRTATLTGNRDYARSWIICTLERAWRKEGRKYLRLFFLDQATALAAGFRPCNRCQRALLQRFLSCWEQVHGAPARVADINAQLARERGQYNEVAPSSLPTGAMIDVLGQPALVIGGRMRAWSFDGYGAAAGLPASARLITPRSTVEVLRAGFAPGLHESANG